VRRGGRAGFAVTCIVLAGLAAAAGPAGSAAAPSPHPPAGLDWTRLMPPPPGPVSPQPHPVAHCLKARVRCIGVEVRRLKRLRAKLGCDHRAVFATTYLTLTKTLRKTLRSGPRKTFAHPAYLYYEDALFADIYFWTTHAHEHGAEVAPAWRIAYDTAASGNANAAQDMLLGINAHVQNDMPFVIAALGEYTRGGVSRLPDHEAVNGVLARAYGPVVHAIRNRYDPVVGVTNSDLTPLDDFTGLALVANWRDTVWREAGELDAATTQAERDQVASRIEQNAATWATLIANANAGLPPGYRASRDGYCRAHNRA
jgi:Family of unknown function (DUF5995)